MFASPTGGPLSPNTDYHALKRLPRNAGVRDGRLHDVHHTAAIVLLILGVPNVVINSIMGWEPGQRVPLRSASSTQGRARTSSSRGAGWLRVIRRLPTPSGVVQC
ncbi:hypothetical protein [Streptomyces althioticus]|uniref:hypothetical protein n=1 Tax=Streptomyces althioticus TaxID=83380 RepID=UPI0036FDBF0A